MRDTSWPRNEIDRFILAQLEAAGLRPAGKADPRTLIRRVTYDLTGLPPTPAEIDAFLAQIDGMVVDDDPDVRALVTTLLGRAGYLVAEAEDGVDAFEQALAAYNAGSDRVDDWMGQGKYRDPQEFVESIPFTETRIYVQRVMQNLQDYRDRLNTQPADRCTVTAMNSRAS